MIYCIDPGTEKSGVITIRDDGMPVYGEETVLDAGCGVHGNVDVLRHILTCTPGDGYSQVVIEKFVARGLRVAQDSIDTVFWSGRFAQACRKQFTLITRRDVLWAMCGSMKGNDTAVRMAIVDLFGGKDKAIGKKKTPGPLYGIKDHVWSALAVGLTYLEQLKEKS